MNTLTNPEAKFIHRECWNLPIKYHSLNPVEKQLYVSDNIFHWNINTNFKNILWEFKAVFSCTNEH